MAAFWRVLRCSTVLISTSGEFNRPMVVTMPVMHMVQVAIHQIIHMVAMRYGFMPATGTVHVAGFMSAARVAAGAILRILRRHRQDMLVKVAFVRMMQMPVVQVVDMVFMLNRRVPAPGPMNVRMIFVYVMFHIYVFPFVAFLIAATGKAVSVECASALNTSPATC